MLRSAMGSAASWRGHCGRPSLSLLESCAISSWRSERGDGPTTGDAQDDQTLCRRVPLDDQMGPVVCAYAGSVVVKCVEEADPVDLGHPVLELLRREPPHF